MRSITWGSSSRGLLPAAQRPGLALQDRVAQAWIHFARAGNPNQPGLEWRPWTAADPQAMVFDTVSESRALGDERLVSLMTAPA